MEDLICGVLILCGKAERSGFLATTSTGTQSKLTIIVNSKQIIVNLQKRSRCLVAHVPNALEPNRLHKLFPCSYV